MTIESFKETDNPYRSRILRMIRENNQATNPSVQEMTNKWITDDDAEELDLKEATEKFYQERTQQVLVETKDQELRGFFLLEENDEYIKKHVPEYWPHLEITLAVVGENSRGKGIATKLVNHREKHVAEQLGHENLVWITSSKNQESQNFATSKGFKQQAKLQDDRDDGLHTLIYGKKI